MVDVRQRLLVLAAFLMMEAVLTSEMLVSLCKTTWCNNPGDSHLHTCHNENLKLYLIWNTVYQGKYLAK
jgi:hypothetical protein